MVAAQLLSEGPAIDEHRLTQRRDDQRRITLANIEVVHLEMTVSLCRRNARVTQ